MTQSKALWTPEIQSRVSGLLQEIESTRDWGEQMGLSEVQLQTLLAGYYEMLEQVYSSDMQLARLMDDSDLVLGAQGPEAILKGSPISVITSLLDNAKKQVVGVARTINQAAGKRFPKEYEPEFMGIAPGSIYIGVSAPDSDKTGGLFAEDDPLHRSVQEALDSIGVVSRLISEDKNIDEISEVVSDPVVRDAAIRAVQSLAPTSKSGIDRVIIAGNSVPKASSAEGERRVVLTSEDRSQARELVKKPRKSHYFGTFTGEVREIDLDQRRFDIRRIHGLDLSVSIRCIYAEGFDSFARQWLDKVVSVSGSVENNAEGEPRLIFVENVQIKASQTSSPSKSLLN